MSNSSTISIQIPENAEPGDVLTFVVNGNELELEIPIGSKVGDVLEIQLAAPEEEEQQEAEDDEEIVFDLPNKKQLRLLQHKKGQEEENNSNDGTYGFLWPAGRLLAESGVLSKLPKATGNILELGSGSGLVGLAYAASLCDDDGCSAATRRRFVLTDSDTSLLQTNVDRNHHIVSSNIKIDTQVLEWGSSTNQIRDKFSLIIGSDLLYNPSCIPDLIRTIQYCLDDTVSCTFVMSVRWRKPELERVFFQQTEEKLGISWTLYRPTGCFLSWQEFGNPKSDASNSYLSQTTISVEGKLKALCDISELDADNMSNDEYDTWERAFCQIYIGFTKTTNVEMDE